MFSHLPLVVDRDAIADVDDLRHGQLLGRRSTFELGREVFGERAQQARDDALFLFAEKTAVLIGDAAQSFTDGLDVPLVAPRFGDPVEFA